MPPLDDEIDRLFQLPPAEFAQARAALAKRAGAQATRVKSLQKPTLAAWSVNQLYWRRRKTYDRLVAAAERARAALSQALAGRGGETSSADRAYEHAVNQAANEAREILTAVGVATSPTTLKAVRDTLLALPGSERPGRLVRSLLPSGFEGLASILQRAGRGTKRAATVLPFGPATTSARPRQSQDGATAGAAARAREKQAVLARRRELAKIEADLREARAATRRAETTLAHARQIHTKAERRLHQLQAETETAASEVARTEAEIRRLERASKDAATAREQFEFRRSSLVSPTE